MPPSGSSALRTHGKRRRWPTPTRDGVLGGNLYLKGSGDGGPDAGALLAAAAAAAPAASPQFAGDLVLDRSDSVLPPHVRPPSTTSRCAPYNAGPDALLTNFKEPAPDPGAGPER